MLTGARFPLAELTGRRTRVVATGPNLYISAGLVLVLTLSRLSRVFVGKADGIVNNTSPGDKNASVIFVLYSKLILLEEDINSYLWLQFVSH